MSVSEDTKTEIINLSLDMIGAERISGTEEDSKAAIRATAIYNQCRKECLEIPEDWYFALTRQQLSKLSDTPAFGSYEYYYIKPDNCIRIVATVNEADETIKFQYEEEVYKQILGSTTNLVDVLLCNEEDVYVKYIIDRDEPAKYPAWFRRLIAAKIATYLAAPLRGGADNYTSFQIEKIWLSALNDAKTGNSSHQKIIENNKDIHEGCHEVLEASSGDLSAL